MRSLARALHVLALVGSANVCCARSGDGAPVHRRGGSPPAQRRNASFLVQLPTPNVLWSPPRQQFPIAARQHRGRRPPTARASSSSPGSDASPPEDERIFEKILDFPTDFELKVIGDNEGSFQDDMMAIVSDTIGCPPAEVTSRMRQKGKYASVTIQCTMPTADILYATYSALDADARVKFKF